MPRKRSQPRHRAILAPTQPPLAAANPEPPQPVRVRAVCAVTRPERMYEPGETFTVLASELPGLAGFITRA